MPVIIDTANGPVALKEMWDGHRKGIEIQRGPWVAQRYQIDRWEDADAVCNALMGGTSTSGSATVHVPGFRCPTSPNLSCTSATVEGEAEVDEKDGGPARFNLPIISVEYGIRSWDQLDTDDPEQFNSFVGNPGGPATYAIHGMDIGVESVKVPGSAYTFKADPRYPADIPFVVHLGVATLHVELKRVPYLPSITILRLVGKLNDATFFGAPRGRILFAGGRTSKEFESDGTRVQNVAYTFRYRARDWNMLIRPDDGLFDFVENEFGERPYGYEDLRPLIALQGFAGMGTLTADE